VKALWTAGALLAALLLQSTIGVLAPSQGRTVDPFLLVVVYCGLVGGETHGMLAGMAAGWVQDIHFGGPVAGLSGLTKLLVGFGVGLAGSRFLIAGTVPRMAVLFVASLADVILFERLALVFELPSGSLSVLTLLARATANALTGALLFELVEMRFRRREIRL
jgi:cell shape-determining protein MreD